MGVTNWQFVCTAKKDVQKDTNVDLQPPPNLLVLTLFEGQNIAKKNSSCFATIKDTFDINHPKKSHPSVSPLAVFTRSQSVSQSVSPSVVLGHGLENEKQDFPTLFCTEYKGCAARSEMKFCGKL